MIWVWFVREPARDAAYWPGRNLLALADAIVWPLALVGALLGAPFATGIVLPVCAAFAVLNAVTRTWTALVANHRYRFTTWRCGRVLVVLLVIGLGLKMGAGWR